MREYEERKMLQDYIASHYFGEDEKEVWAMSCFWLEKAVYQEKGDKFFHEDYEREYYAGLADVKVYR